MTIADKLDLFFKKPSVSLKTAGVIDTNPDFAGAACKRYSTLYLLRRDVKRCFRPSEPIYWPGTTTVLAGIDLLAKLYAGSDTGAIGTRFQTFVQQHMSPTDGLRMWQLRNALMHSFGVAFNDPAATTGSAAVPRRFRLNAIDLPPGTTYTSLFLNISTDVVEVNIKQIRDAFERSIQSYEAHIRGNAAEQLSHFEPMYDKYGWIWICQYPVTAGCPLTTFVPMASGG